MKTFNYSQTHYSKTSYGKTSYGKKRGFSLIELMIVVAVVGLLAAVAYPSYLDQVRKGKRATAATSILECAAIMERRYTITSNYEDDVCGTVDADNEDYDITVNRDPNGLGNCISDNNNSDCYLITAAATGPSVGNDEACATMTYNHLNAKGSTIAGGGDGENSICWRTN